MPNFSTPNPVGLTTRIRRKQATAHADNAATEFVKREGNSAGMPGEMSQMVTERPNAGAVRHQDRCGVIRRPRGGGFVPIVAHDITPIDVAAGVLEMSARS